MCSSDLPAPVVDDPERAAIVSETRTMPAALEAALADVARIELPGEGVDVWMKHRADLAKLDPLDRESAWKALCKRTEKVGKMKGARVWLKKAISTRDADAAKGVA